MGAIKSRIEQEVRGFFDAVRKANEPIYLILLSLYVLIFAILKTAWASNVDTQIGYFRYGLLSVVMWGSGAYLLFVIASWKNLWKNAPALIIIGAAIFGAIGYFSRKMSTNSYGVVFDVFFCLMACGKDFRKILRCILYVIVSMLVIAFIGTYAGFTYDVIKEGNGITGYSMGINYPNTWGYIVFLALMILWYLRLRNRPILTFLVFWGMIIPMFFHASCRTISLLNAVFPPMALFVDWLERSAKQKPGTKVGIFGWVVVALPFIAFAFMYFVSMQYKWVHKYLYPTFFLSFAMRFVQGGLYFKTYGIPIFGNPYRSNVHTFVNVNGTFEEVGILDSSFAAYIIMRGIVWLTYTLAWMSFAIWKALRRRDYAIPFLAGIILVFAMMERPGLEMWYDFILLYPLAKIANDPLEIVLEAPAADEAIPEIAENSTPDAE